MKLILAVAQLILFVGGAATVPALLAQAEPAAPGSVVELLPHNVKEIGAFAILALVAFFAVKSVPFLVTRTLQTIDNVVSQFREEQKVERESNAREREMDRAHYKQMLELQAGHYLENKKVLADSFSKALDEIRSDTSRLETALNRLTDAVSANTKHSHG